MEINYYRQPNSQGTQASWDACQFTSATDLSRFTVEPLVTINGQPFLQQHHVTYLTGRETCRAHHFAKHLAVKVLSSQSDQSSDSNCKVLWIDTINGPHVSAAICRELAAHATAERDLHFVCLDILGGQRDDVWCVTRCIESLIKKRKPQLVVIDDIDHFMPNCGINIATEFSRVVRDTVNHTDTAFLFIGYNHLGKQACTTGNLGKRLFINATNIFSLSTQREVTTVRHISGYDLSHDPDDCEFRFTIGTDNLPHEVAPAHQYKATAIDDNTLCDIVTDILQPGQTITPDELLQQVTTRQRQLRQQDRAAGLLNQAVRLDLLRPVPNNDDTGNGTPISYSISPTRHPSSQSIQSIQSIQSSSSSPSSLSSSSSPSSTSTNQVKGINTSLTLPRHLQPVPAPALFSGA